jgi:methylmalonyl-CoA mutase
MRSSDDEKQHQIQNLEAFQARRSGQSEQGLRRLQAVAREGGNLFEALMETVNHCSLGQITDALFEVGGQYRRNM